MLKEGRFWGQFHVEESRGSPPPPGLMTCRRTVNDEGSVLTAEMWFLFFSRIAGEIFLKITIFFIAVILK
jgi:hypothetical protein